jgi:predicted amidohydrolase
VFVLRELRVAAVQLPSLEGFELDDAFQAVTEATSTLTDRDLVLLPEMWTPGYFDFDRYHDAAAAAPKIRSFLADLARTLDCHLHGGSFVEQRGEAYYNTSVLFDRVGDQIADYSKIHLFGYGSREPEVLEPGVNPTVVETEIGQLGMVVCYDLRFPELFRTMTDMGAEMVLVASAWPFPRVGAWSTLLRARALENQVFVVAANGVGPTVSGPPLCGNSGVVDPWGTAIASVGDEPGAAEATIDLDSVAETRHRFRQLADRRLMGGRQPGLMFRRPGDRPLQMPVKKVAIAGYTGRDQEAVARYVAKLEEEGIAAPESTPVVFPCGVDRVVCHDVIDVTGDRTCGEVEFVLLVTREGIHVTVGSDHTDRALEQDSIVLSKQVVPKVVADVAWRLDDVADHWDRLVLKSWVGEERRPYQETGVDFFLSPDDILELVGAEPGTVIFGGTVSSLAGGFDFDPMFHGSLIDPLLERTIDFHYRSRPLEGS